MPSRRSKRATYPLEQPAMLLFGDLQSIQFENLIRKLLLDDALIQPPWRLEYVYLNEGFAHYRLLHDERLIGIRDVTSRRQLAAIHRGLAAYLAQCGARPELALILKAGARACLEDAKHRIDPLFMLIGEQRKGRRMADMVRVYSLSAS